ncbi:MAG: tetratricopeptide repeat protein [Candidatus Sericytochromatia bacterium]|nr:tetratricopeptide repeat protein [Candidatus Tanganyikabacteria bacterium]
MTRTCRVAALAAAIAIAAGLATIAPAIAGAPAASRAESLVGEGIDLYDDGAFSRAITKLQEALQVEPRNAKGLYYLANAYWRLEDYDRATDAFSRLVKADPKGPFAADARDWLDAQGNFEVIASRIKAQPYSGLTTPRTAGPRGAAMQDGRTRIDPPPGWDRAADEVVKDPSGRESYRLGFKKVLGAEGQAAHLVVEAHHRDATPAPASGRKAVPGLTEIGDRILSDLGIDDYQVTRSRQLDAGQELEIASEKRGGVQGTIRAVWEGGTLLVAVALAPRGTWPAVSRQVAGSVGTLRTSAAPASERKAAAATASVAASPAPARTPSLAVPTMYQRQPGDPTLPPAFYPAPWATPTP